jgi:hypothetical protein
VLLPRLQPSHGNSLGNQPSHYLPANTHSLLSGRSPLAFCSTG